VIDVKSLTEEDVGRWVVYEGGFCLPQKGRIKSWNDKYIFVVYKCNGEWDRYQDYTGVATDPKDLEFLDEKGNTTLYLLSW